MQKAKFLLKICEEEDIPSENFEKVAKLAMQFHKGLREL